VFNRLLPQPSEFVTVTLPRPMGVVFEYDKREAVLLTHVFPIYCIMVPARCSRSAAI
jgi:hypothetical protein